MRRPFVDCAFCTVRLAVVAGRTTVFLLKSECFLQRVRLQGVFEGGVRDAANRGRCFYKDGAPTELAVQTLGWPGKPLKRLTRSLPPSSPN
jgi:hypothetical protein